MRVWRLRDGAPLEFTVQAFQRLLFGGLGLRFDLYDEALELEFWKGAIGFQPEPGIHEALSELAAAGVRMGVVSNSAFSCSGVYGDSSQDWSGSLALHSVTVSAQPCAHAAPIGSPITATVPLAEVADYGSTLKAITQGEGFFSMELSHYEPVPSNVAQQVIAKLKAQQEEEK